MLLPDTDYTIDIMSAQISAKQEVHTHNCEVFATEASSVKETLSSFLVRAMTLVSEKGVSEKVASNRLTTLAIDEHGVEDRLHRRRKK